MERVLLVGRDGHFVDLCPPSCLVVELGIEAAGGKEVMAWMVNLITSRVQGVKH